MFNYGPKPKSGLETAIDTALLAMSTHDPDSEEYAKIVKQLAKLHKLKENESPKRVTPDTLFTVAANIFTVLVIVNHERAHVITTKALNFATRA